MTRGCSQARRDPPKSTHMSPQTPDPQDLVEEATADYAMGDAGEALAKLGRAIELDNGCYDAYLAQAEVYFSLRQWDRALQSARRALAVNPEDILIHTTLSRIWMEKGDKAQAESHGAQARMLGWKAQLKEPPPEA